MLNEPTLAPAKINLALHVTGQRDDGYHLLDSLVVFAGVGDTISARASTDLTLSVTGPFAQGVPTDGRNLVLQAADVLRQARNVKLGAHITLKKMLPHAAGIGSGSSDAAATLDLLSRIWKVDPLPLDDPAVLKLGADVPVCRRAPAPVRMAGIGEEMADLPRLPDCAMVLVNPGEAVPTAAVFSGLASKSNPSMPGLPSGLDFKGFCDWLSTTRNDLQPPAETIAPGIVKAITLLRRQPEVACAVMSGSGATCVGLVPDFGAAQKVARAIQVAEMGWWVAPAPMLG
ncbi:4-(cytidine 5'-diphospho)-2-C-methyl-D-erythritol kinase [Ponticoccus sp. SC2-23]|uniref:4-(cytidine 5'-diphospho)-2-C-methyl-D-erythritol kinase n=1 Tax=Alexandriicola marinus TaxID=2081710 RepID=UPI000FD719D0|nr:4-(cytidine 5'-diphospho)-2-C-methyl-D-erythritol kinase [Alexandriicola marinus]MBM1220372.1 4-(cytidine 5'-diphospho)-2-C-methyl-D-erythritol kinase [Ponticoccus sp. SC6-9]MBM1225058.1 4-(cytidine 5'-diphospho)-2-C-methyl-D-erythritol kinase [Ponticoccus sp. SC6-15]MBM1228572.1 4-(cytidine 5'-diphospho)-2-C-methyl-D-erythritol kinase [Ponticoccus sp. SC6-38]MBM1233791.1 4-(cytidine 5'-diphospho)-2-C-methyl-D-erythritol kinase [Ponticoccus sp. SC6-45]MBM1239073.1 4-(cytidine 5'-diphospho)-